MVPSSMLPALAELMANCCWYQLTTAATAVVGCMADSKANRNLITEAALPATITLLANPHSQLQAVDLLFKLSESDDLRAAVTQTALPGLVGILQHEHCKGSRHAAALVVHNLASQAECRKCVKVAAFSALTSLWLSTQDASTQKVVAATLELLHLV